MIKALIAVAHTAQSQVPPEGQELDAIAASWELVVGEIPIEYLEECFRRALRVKRDNFPLSAVEVNTQWLDYKEELRRKRLTLPAGNQDHEIRKPRFTFAEWKAHHSEANPAHNADKCVVCCDRDAKGLRPLAEVKSFSDLISVVGRTPGNSSMSGSKHAPDAKGPTGHVQEGMPQEKLRGEQLQANQEVDPLIEDDEIDLPF